MKKRTKENLHKSISKRPIIKNEKIENYNDNYKPQTENKKNKIINKKNGSFVTVNNLPINNSRNIYRNNNISVIEQDDTIDEMQYKKFYSKSTERRRTNNSNNYLPSSIENDDYDDCINEFDNNIIKRINYLDNTYSSKNYDTNNHMTLIEVSNEIRKPSDYVNESFIKEKDSRNSRNKIKDLLLTSFDNSNNLCNSLTESKESDNRTKKSSINYETNISITQKYKKIKNFTISLPINDKDELEKKDLNKQGYVKITPKKVFNKKLNEDKNTNAKTVKTNTNKINFNFLTPSNDYYINWKNGNSTYSRIVKNETNSDFTSNNSTNKRRYQKRALHYKCRSSFDTSENEDSNHTNINRSDYSRKKLFFSKYSK